jgi:CBS domain-containing protein
MRVKELMHRDVFTIRDNESVESLLEVLVGEHLHGAPVIDEEGRLVGVVSQQDIFFGTMTREGGTGSRVPKSLEGLHVKDIMTSPAVSADEETELAALCRMMYKLRIHRVPIVNDGRVTGIVSSLDICAAFADGNLD